MQSYRVFPVEGSTVVVLREPIGTENSAPWSLAGDRAETPMNQGARPGKPMEGASPSGVLHLTTKQQQQRPS